MKKLVFLLAAIGFSIFAYGAYIPAKAVLAQYLINDAWNDSIRTGEIHKPWEWADMYPVMKLSSQKHNKDLIVLSGDKGNSLAFAPGYNINSYKPNQGGTTVISGHRDTHFRFLKEVSINDVFELTDRNNITASYTVSDIAIIDATEQGISIHSNEEEVKLVTCYPFDAIIAGGPLRYVVTAKLI
jgi:sortase A